MSYEVRKLNPWTPENNAERLAILGKLAEELGEGTQITARCMIQGIDEAEPVTKVPNKLALEKELADIIATINQAVSRLGLDKDFIFERARGKSDELATWYDGLRQ